MDSEEIARIYGMMSVEEVIFYKNLIETFVQIDDPLIINIGAGVGTSTIAALEVRPEAFIFSVDNKPALEEGQNLYLCGIQPSKALRILADSAVAGRFFPLMVDLVFVDGEHTQEQIYGDILVWIAKVKLGGLMLFHDYKHPNVPWITEAVDNAMKAGFEYLGEERFLVAFRREK